MKRCKRGKILFGSLLVFSFAIILLLYAKLENTEHEENGLENINNYSPIALLEDTIVYDYFNDDDEFVIGCYDIESKNLSDVICVDGFYISSGLPAVIEDSVILPVTLYTNEHKLLMINADSNTSDTIFNDYNSSAIDVVSTMNTAIYMLSTIRDNSIETSYIRKYNETTNKMDICIKKEFVNNTGEQIIAFACSNERIYVIVNQIEEDDTYIEIYDDKNYDLIGKLYFDSELRNDVSENGIIQFYCFNDYIYVRNFSDYGAIGKIENDQVKTVLNLYNLRIAYNGRNTQDNYYGFFLRGGKDFYILDVDTDILYQTNLGLSQDESFRNVLSNGNDICICILDETDTEAFTTKNTTIVDFDELINEAYQIKPIADYLN